MSEFLRRVFMTFFVSILHIFHSFLFYILYSSHTSISPEEEGLVFVVFGFNYWGRTQVTLSPSYTPFPVLYFLIFLWQTLPKLIAQTSFKLVTLLPGPGRVTGITPSSMAQAGVPLSSCPPAWFSQAFPAVPMAPILCITWSLPNSWAVSSLTYLTSVPSWSVLCRCIYCFVLSAYLQYLSITGTKYTLNAFH